MNLFILLVMSLGAFPASISAMLIRPNRDFYVTAPRTIRLGSEEKIAVVIEGETSLSVEVAVTDSSTQHIFYHSESLMLPGEPKIFTFKLDPTTFYDKTSPGDSVFISVASQEFTQEINVPIVSKTGFVFIQTDKPIYSPEQTAFLRVISLNDNALPSGEPFMLEIRNPQGIKVDERLFNEPGRAFVNHTFDFPKQSPLGEWEARVLYGYKFQQSAFVRFDLYEYVLPTFTVKLEAPQYIFPDTNEIQIHVHAKSVYGKKVEGSASLAIGLSNKGHGIFRKNGLKLVNGSCTFNLNIAELELLNDERGHYKHGNLIFEVEVIEKATGIKKSVKKANCIFIERRLQIHVENTQPCFKHGINFPVELLISNEAYRPVSGIQVVLEGEVDKKEKLNIIERDHISDQNGIVYFRIRTKPGNSEISLKITTNSTAYESTTRIFLIEKCKISQDEAFIAIQRTRTNKFKVGDIISRQIYFEPSSKIEKAYLTISSKGKIISQEVIHNEGRGTSIDIPVTRDMVPSARITVFADYKNELVADSIKIETIGLCKPTKEVSIHSQFDNKEPGASGQFVLRGKPNTLVGLLGVDEAIYDLSKKDILDDSKVRHTLNLHDLGIVSKVNLGAHATLLGAGLIVVKNEIEETPISGGVAIQEFQEPVVPLPLEISRENVEYFEKALRVRTDFRETWFFKDFLIGSKGVVNYDVILPDSITTWNIQAVSVSHEDGLCIADPQTLISTKKIFVQLNLPKSVKKNEQILIPSTLFNYGTKRIVAIIFINGSDHLRVTDEEETQRREERISVNPGSGVTVTFPVTPLEEGKIRVNVTAITDDGSDVISRILDVRPEGFITNVEHTIPIDPEKNRTRRSFNETASVGLITETVNVRGKAQNITIKLKFPENMYPGSEKCEISAIGDQYGTAVETALNDPARFLRMPYGCGEQNVMFMAPTLYALDYLDAVNELTPEIREKGRKYIKKGFATQLLYRNSDGSFSSFQNFPPNLWLTAYVLKVFCQAKKMVSIDEKVLRTGLNWLLEKQEIDGSFNETYPLFHIDMTKDMLGNIPLTAHVLVTLEACSSEDGIKGLYSGRLKALNYIQENVDEVENPLHLAIVAYALALSNSRMKNATYDKLCRIATYDEEKNFMYWEVSQKSARTIEATSYALLTVLLHDDRVRANSIVNWLKTQQLKSGSYKSTQDTVVTLQALSVYAKKTKTQKIDLLIKVKSSLKGNVHQITINNDNMRKLQNVKLDKPGNELNVVATGYGSGSLFVGCTYFVKNTTNPYCKFKVKVTVSKEHDTWGSQCFVSDLTKTQAPIATDVKPAFSNENVLQTKGGNALAGHNLNGNAGVKVEHKRNDNFLLKVSVCARSLLKDPTEMSIIDVGIFSGFEPIEEDLQKLMNCKNMQSYQIYGYGITFYLKTIPSDEDYCFHFHITRDICVNDVQKSMVKVYDYYSPDYVCTSFYEPGEWICPPIGGCPPENPLKDFKNYTTEKAIKLKDIICHKYDFAWIVAPECTLTEEGKLLSISYKIKKIIKNDIENSSSLVGQTVFFSAAKLCDVTQYQQCDGTYLVMGNSMKITDLSEGQISYVLDENSIIEKIADTGLNWVLEHVQLIMEREGCGCPGIFSFSENPFYEIPAEEIIFENNCRGYDILWYGKLLCEERKIENGYYSLNFEIISVFYEGSEKEINVVGKNRTFLIDDSCPIHTLRSCTHYMIYAKEGEKYGGIYGEKDFKMEYRYILTNKSSLVPLKFLGYDVLNQWKESFISQMESSNIVECEN